MSNTVCDPDTKRAAVPRLPYLRVLCFTISVVKDSIECSVPACCGGHLEKKDEGLEECLEVVDVIEARANLDMLEQAHSEDGEDEHNEEEKEAYVEEGRQGHDE